MNENESSEALTWILLVCCDRPPRTCHRIYSGLNRVPRRGIGREDEGKPLMRLVEAVSLSPVPAESSFGDRRTRFGTAYGQGWTGERRGFG